jgi:nitrogen fixation NifU-like protein
MSLLRELYQEMIVDHSRRPRNYGVLQDAVKTKEGFNPLCGDRLTIFLSEKDKTVNKLQFEGSGCAISIASASLMTEAMQGKSREEVDIIFNDFIQLVTKGHDELLEEKLGKLAVLAGVAEFPSRVKCATLAWHTFKSALNDDSQPVSTE